MSFVYITEDGAFIKKRGGNFIVGQGDKEVMEIPEAVLDGLADVKSGKVVDGKAAIQNIRSRYGI